MHGGKNPPDSTILARAGAHVSGLVFHHIFVVGFSLKNRQVALLIIVPILPGFVNSTIWSSPVRWFYLVKVSFCNHGLDCIYCKPTPLSLLLLVLVINQTELSCPFGLYCYLSSFGSVVVAGNLRVVKYTSADWS
jgi:hypothetical protein